MSKKFRKRSKQVHLDNDVSEVDILGQYGTFWGILKQHGRLFETTQWLLVPLDDAELLAQTQIIFEVHCSQTTLQGSDIVLHSLVVEGKLESPKTTEHSVSTTGGPKGIR